MRPKISVVIPAHDPGRYIEPCIRSLLRQTMPRDDFEVVFVDDGSTDGTAGRLDRLAQEQPNIRVIHIPASGAPGRPRNIGLEAALGEYIQFLDADDELAPRALRRLYRMARANDSDVVIGKFASETMNRKQDLFTRNRPKTTLFETPLLADTSMGPTKLFRAALLRDHDISFPEGWRQMEDQLFVLRAYLAARVISILGDEPCYFFNKREDERHISSELVDPESHVQHLREILDEIDRRVTDPTMRDRLKTRFYRLEVLNRLSGANFLEAPAAYRKALFEALRGVARERYAGWVGEGLGAFARMRSRLILDGGLRELSTLARRVEAITVDASVARAGWVGGRLAIEFRAVLSRGEPARPIVIHERGDRLLLDPGVADDLLGPVDVTDEVGQLRVKIAVKDPETALEWIIPGGARLSLQPGRDLGNDVRLPVLLGRIEFDPLRVGPGERALDDGTWEFLVRWAGLGLNAAGVLRVPRRVRHATAPPLEPGLLGRPPRWVVPRFDDDGRLGVAIGGLQRAPARLDDASRRLVRDGARIVVSLPIATDGRGPIEEGVVRLEGDRGTYELPATFSGSLGGVLVAVGNVRALGALPGGHYEVSAHMGGREAPGLSLGSAVVRDDGRVVLLRTKRESAFARFRNVVGWAAREGTSSVRTAVARAVRQVPAPARDVIRSAYGRLRV